MTFDWVDYLILAKTLQTNAKNQNSLREAMLRSAISRAYYSVFNIAKNYLISLGIRFDGSAEEHRIIQKKFEDLSQRESDGTKRLNLAEISNSLSVLRSFRNKADYETVVSGIDRKGEAAVIRAEKVYDLIISL